MSEKHWWEELKDEQSGNKDIEKLIVLIEKADSSRSQKDVEKAKDSIAKAKAFKKKGTEDLRGKLERKLRIVEKSIERALSDNFGALVKYERTKKDLTLARLGEMTGMSPSYINRLEKGERKAPGYAIVKSLAEALDVPLSEMLQVAGVTSAEEETSTPSPIGRLVLSNNVSYKEGGESISKKEKECLVGIIEAITGFGWDGKTKHHESLELLHLIDKFKEIQGK